MLGSLIIAAMISLLIMLSAQETFRDILVPLGLYHSEAGIFTDCSLPENQNIKYCQPPQSPAAKQWKTIREGPGFKLSDQD